MEINQKIINEIKEALGIKPIKDLGQNFLIDVKTAEKIAESIDTKNDDFLLEVGGGLGSITHFLNGKSENFDVVDVDSRMCKFLTDTYAKNNIKIIENDVRKIDVSEYTKIIGNLPYYITTELITFFLLNAKKCTKFVFMVQAEAAERFLVDSGKDYGAISVLVRLLGTPKKLFNVKPSAFYPVPNCGSTVFEIAINKEDKEMAYKVYKMAKQLFLNRRKTILNNLNNYTKNKEISLKSLQNSNILPNTRPEQIKPETYIKLYNELKNFNF